MKSSPRLIPDPSDRRKKPRYTVAEIVELYAVGTTAGYLGSGVLNNISETGAAVQMDAPIIPGTVLELFNENGSVKAVCRHVNATFSGYLVGVEFVDGPDLKAVNAWSPLPATW